MSDFIPDEMILQIFKKLPVKALSRSKLVSKRWKKLISHSKFAQSHFESAHMNQTLTRSLLLSASTKTPPARIPRIGPASLRRPYVLEATGDYKLVQLSANYGVIVNEKLHWVIEDYNLEFDEEEDPIVAFDLESEEFRRLRIPFPKVEGDDSVNFSVAIFCSEGCLCPWRYGRLAASGSVAFWVMERYEDNDSWNMRYSFRISNETPIKFLKPLIVTESSQVLVRCSTAAELELVRIRRQERRSVSPV